MWCGTLRRVGRAGTVCGMDVEIATARHLAQYEDTLYYFCSVGCRARFVRDPASYVGAGTSTAAESD